MTLSAEFDPDEAFEMIIEELNAELGFPQQADVGGRGGCPRAFEVLITLVRPSEPIIRIETIGGVPIAYRGQEEIGPVHIVGGLN
jgi:hypothetical protein